MKKSLFKKLAVPITVMSLAISIIGCSAEESSTSSKGAGKNKVSGEKIILRLSEAQVDDYPDSRAEKKFAKIVEEKSDGRIKVDVYTAGQLGDEKTTIEQTQVGVIDMGRANAGPLTQFAEKFGVFSFPFLFDSRDHMWKAIDGGLGDELFKNLEEKGDLVGLAFYDAGARNFYSKDPISKLKDVKGKKIRVMQNDILIDAFKELGVSPTPLSASEVYSALQMGVIDGGENNVSTYVADGHFEIAKNFTESEHLRIPGVLFMSKKTWDKLSSEDQKIIKEAAKESEKFQQDAYDKYSDEAMKKVEEKGNKVIQLSKEDREAFRDKVKPVYDKYKDQFGDLFKTIDDAK
ncbi:TRAP transporter substrate-binding protein [Neobacillus drentensis]|uniref:TRAP transporter substrate-binding protein n=1 Tax=Neobacillus drentensis TaxID=220684 RepID=UPI002FFFC166